MLSDDQTCTNFEPVLPAEFSLYRRGGFGAEPINEEARAFPEPFFRQALEQASDDSGWAHLGTFGSYLNKLRPDFDSRNFGYKKLSDLVKARCDLFETEERAAAGRCR